MLKHKARKRFGQNFLHDAYIIQRIVQSIQPKEGDNIVEIGPGQAALTGPLIERAKHIQAIEIDRDLHAFLHNQFTQEQITIHNVDALKFDFSSILDNGKKLRVVGNLPYNISTPLMFHLLQYKDCIIDMHFMLQKEVVARMAATPGSKTYGKLSVILQYYCDVHYLFTVKPGAFNPAPQVDSAIVRLQPYNKSPVDVGDEKIFSQLVSKAFAQRRKTLRNNLKGILQDRDIESCDINPNARPETLSLQAFARLSRQWHTQSLNT